MAVDDGRRIDPDGARIFQIVLDRDRPRRLFIAEDIGRNRHPAPMADEGDQFFLCIHFSNQGQHAGDASQFVRRKAARDDDPGKTDGLHLIERDIRDAGIAMLGIDRLSSRSGLSGLGWSAIGRNGLIPPALVWPEPGRSILWL
jgi:hypothetical protein